MIVPMHSASSCHNSKYPNFYISRSVSTTSVIQTSASVSTTPDIQTSASVSTTPDIQYALHYITSGSFHCVSTPYLTDDCYTPPPTGPAKRQKKTSRVSPPTGPVHYNPLARWPSSCFIRQRDVTS